jgi:hypothetical protein
MLKRTKGRVLLALLVVTGFAGTLNDNTLTKQERKSVVSYLKDAKTDLFKTIKGLSAAQLDYKVSPDDWSIKETIYHLATQEEELWSNLEKAMKEPPSPETQSLVKLSDEDVAESAISKEIKIVTSSLHPGRGTWQSLNEALLAFKNSRSQHLKYVKTTTADLRGHFIQLSEGWIDCYQFIIFMAEHSNMHISRINTLTTETAFPKK